MSEEQVQYAPETPAEPAAETPVETPAAEEPKEDGTRKEIDTLYKKLENLAKENKNLIRSQQAMANQWKQTVDATVKQKMAELNAAKDEAIDSGDRQKVRDIEEQMDAVKQQAQAVQPQNTLDPAIQEFVSANSSWFNTDKEMTAFAISYNEAYLKEHPGDLEKSLDETLKKVKLAFPDKFKSDASEPDKKPASPVESGSRQTSGNKYSIGRLSEEQKIAYDQYVKRHKLMSHDDYFKSLEEAGFLA